MTLKQVVEALVFASPKPITIKEIVAALKAAGDKDKTDDTLALEFAKSKEADVAAALADIASELVATDRAFRLVEQINGWALMTDPSAVHWVRQLYPEAKPTRLTGPQLETLAIIAYRQPVTRADIEAVRGVAVDSVVQVLTERSLIKIAGRAEVPGRPLLYETTQYFLQHFGIKTVDELPNAQELKRVELPKAPVPEEPAQEAGDKSQEAGVAESAAETPAAEIAAAEVPANETLAPEVVAAESEAVVVEVSDEAPVAEESTEPAEPVAVEESAPEGAGENPPEQS
jgi:segregation and condensation protein B